MTKILTSPGKYVQGPGEMKKLGEYAAKYGKKALALITENGFYPAYHMNKSNWITVALDGSADNEKIKFLLDMSFDLTSKKTKNERK